MRLTALLILVVFAAFPLEGWSGGPPLRRSGAPGERTCLDAGCHSGRSIPNSPQILLDTGRGLTYRAGSGVQRWLLRASEPGARAWGFQLSARAGVDSALPAGDFREADTRTQVVCGDDRLRGEAGCSQAALPQFVQHVEPHAAGVFDLQWTPPIRDVGPITVYVAVNGSISGQRDSRIHLTQFVLLPDGDPPMQLVNAASQLPGVSPAAWLSLFGSFATSVARAWASADFVDGHLPLSLDGWEVRLAGQPAAISYIGPNQFNLLAPAFLPLGDVDVEVWRDGRRQASARALSTPLSPAVFMLPGRRLAAAVHADGEALDARPARPGDRLLLYATGLAPAPQAWGGTGPWLSVRLAGRGALVECAGLVGPGLYQINLVVPELPDGEAVLELEAYGTLAQRAVVVPVRR